MTGSRQTKFPDTARFPKFFAYVTHVTGIACGNGCLSGGKYCGVAPQAQIVSVKILDRYGQGNSAQAVTGLRWIMDNARKYNIKVVNLSIGTNDRKVNLPLKDAVERLWRMGMLNWISSNIISMYEW